MSDTFKAAVKVRVNRLDPVLLLRDTRAVQQVLGDIAANGPRDGTVVPAITDDPVRTALGTHRLEGLKVYFCDPRSP